MRSYGGCLTTTTEVRLYKIYIDTLQPDNNVCVWRNVVILPTAATGAAAAANCMVYAKYN